MEDDELEVRVPGSFIRYTFSRVSCWWMVGPYHNDDVCASEFVAL